MSSIQDQIRDARLYLVTDARSERGDLEAFLDAALAGGVDVVQLRDKALDDDGITRAATTFRAAADRHGALFILNDRPDLVDATGADGVHIGQDDAAIADARAAVGPDRIVGRSTHAPDQLAAANGADYIAVGPVYATPTKPGRPAAGLDYVRHAAAAADPPQPWFAIGGIDLQTLPAVLAAGARRIVVVRAITEASDPEAAARALRAGIDAREETLHGPA